MERVAPPTPAAAVPVLVGIDLVQVSRTRESIDRFGDRFLRRLFTEGELADCTDAPARLAERLAARFAAKEATFKVLRPPARWLDPRAIEVRRLPGGAPELRLHDEAAALAKAAGLGGFSLSLSHEGDYATAVVLALRTEANREGP